MLNEEVVINDFAQLKGMAKFKDDMYSPYFSSYDSVYPFTNDRLIDIFKEVDCSKGVLTVTASGDQALMAILNDAPYVKMFDINKLAKYFVMFKFAAIKSLSYEEFRKLYKVNIPFSNTIAGGFLSDVDVNLYNKVCSNLDLVNAYFFERLYEFMTNATPTERFNVVNVKQNHKLAGYLNQTSYSILKSKLNDVKKLEFIDCDIFDLKKYIDNEVYSAMIFSNISSYFDNVMLESYLTLLNSLKSNLTSNGLIQAGYGSLGKCFEIGKNRMDKRFVDAHRKYFFETKSHNKVITFYKSNKN